MGRWPESVRLDSQARVLTEPVYCWVVLQPTKQLAPTASSPSHVWIMCWGSAGIWCAARKAVKSHTPCVAVLVAAVVEEETPVVVALTEEEDVPLLAAAPMALLVVLVVLVMLVVLVVEAHAPSTSATNTADRSKRCAMFCCCLVLVVLLLFVFVCACKAEEVCVEGNVVTMRSS